MATGRATARRQSAGKVPLLEREAELARIEEVLASSREGHGGVAMVGGPAGIGKTSLLAVARSAGEAAGTRVLRARGGELEHEFGFGVVRQLFEPLLAEAKPDERAEWLAGAAGLAARLLGLAGAGTTPDPAEGPPDPSFAVLHGLYWLCANVAADRPLCLIVDDAHWADTPSLRYLAFLLPRLEELSVALLIGLRPDEDERTAGLLSSLAADMATELVEPSPLSHAAVERLLREGLPDAPDAEFVAACQRATGGVPFLVEQLVRALREDGVSPTAAAAGGIEALGSRSIGRWVLLRLGRLPARAQQLARAMAILEAGDLPAAAQLAGLEREEAGALSDVLCSAGILAAGSPLAFVHPVVRRAIYDEIGHAERSDGHRRAARLLADRGAAGERVVEHLLAGEPAADEWVVERLRSAAGAAAGSGAPESAAAYLRRALREPPPAELRSALLLELGLAEYNAGQAEGYENLERALEAAANGPGRVAAALVLAQALARDHRFADAVEVLDRVASGLDADGDALRTNLETLAVGIAMLDADTSAANAGRIRAARERVESQAVPTRELLALAGLIAVQANEPAEVAADLARRALRGAGDALPDLLDLPWLQQATVTLLWTERYEELLPLLDAAVSKGRATGDATLFSSPLAYRAWIAVQQGELRAAEADARTALEASGLPAPRIYRVLNAAMAVEALVEQGQLEEAERLVAGEADVVELPASTSACLRLSRGRLRIAQRRLEEGLQDLTGAGAVALQLGFDAPSWLPWRSRAVGALLALGDADAASELASQELELARAFGAPRTLGLALHAVGAATAGSDGEEALRESVSQLRRSSAQLELARALCDLGARLRRGKRRAEARDLLREALDIAHRLGAQPLADRAETELRATGARPRRVMLTGLEALTASERRVAEHAAEGLTNREIAQALFVTARTVEGHLTSVFRKLDVTSREDLGAALAATAAGATAEDDRPR